MTNQNKIQNPEKQVPKTPQMNERDFTNDMLSTEKYFVTSYRVALNEASNEALFQTINQVANEAQNMQRELYTLMFQKGWYGLEKAQPEELSQSYQQFSGYQTQLPYGTQLQ
ncbi:spore coat protein [Bacillus massiliglaciei]|uniref:spore coat protein n=1 Tax=Bacillus massiliglaciei TaxID=1816693 RepID=UPI000B140A68|nr:spore coat protein [Bacillus massiliglaciei]